MATAFFVPAQLPDDGKRFFGFLVRVLRVDAHGGVNAFVSVRQLQRLPAARHGAAAVDDAAHAVLKQLVEHFVTVAVKAFVVVMRVRVKNIRQHLSYPCAGLLIVDKNDLHVVLAAGQDHAAAFHAAEHGGLEVGHHDHVVADSSSGLYRLGNARGDGFCARFRAVAEGELQQLFSPASRAPLSRYSATLRSASWRSRQSRSS